MHATLRTVTPALPGFRSRWFLLPGILLLACTESHDPPTDPGERTRGTGSEEGDLALLAARRAEIEAFIGEPGCSGPGDCAALPLGVKPCGGPWSWLVYSRSAVDTLELQTLVTDYNSLNADLNQRWGWVSDCAMTPSPALACRDGVCVDTLATP